MKSLMIRVINLGNNADYSFNLSRMIRIVNGVSFAVGVLSFLFLIPVFAAPDSAAAIKIVFLFALSIIPVPVVFWLNISKRHWSAFYFLIVFFMVYLAMITHATGQNSGIAINYFAIAIAIVLLIENKVWRVVFFIICILVYTYTSLISSQGFTFFTFSLDYFGYASNVVMGAVLAYYGLSAFKSETTIYQREIEEKNRKLSEQKKEIENKNLQISNSINYAYRIQSALIPDKTILDQYFQECFVLFKPKDIVSGDFYWFQKVDEDIMVVVGDCTGHGVPGAMMSMLGINFLENIVVERKINSPSRVLEELNTAINRSLRQDTTENRDGMDLAICLFNSKTKKLTFSGAGNGILYVKGSGDIEELKPSKRHIGGRQFDGQNPFVDQTIALNKGDRIYLYTDGFKDQFGGPEKRRLMSGGMKKYIHASQNLSMTNQGNKLDELIMAWMHQGKEHQLDDICLAGLKV